MKRLMLILAAAQAPVIPLEGLDPVALVQGRQEDGDKKFSVIRGRFRYTFANAENKAAFEKDPSRYEIQLGGTCARMGPQTGGDADTYYVYEGKIYVFGSSDCHKAFMATPEKYLEAKQPKLKPLESSPASAAAAKKLLDRAVNAMGGASAVDGVAVYQETRERNKEVRTIAYPNRFHVERTFSEKIHVTQTIADGAGFMITPGGARDLSAEAVADLLHEIGRDPLALLRARNKPGFRAAAHDANAVDVEWMGDRSTLVLDPQTGNVAALRYYGRAGAAGFGNIEFQYSDFRKTDNLMLPYKVTQIVDQDTGHAQSIVITAIALNPKIAPAVFEKPLARP